MLVLLPGLLLAEQAQAAPAISQSGVTPLSLGVDQETATIDGSHASIVRVDLAASGIRFATTPRVGSLDTITQRLSQFVSMQGLQLAINANFLGLPPDQQGESARHRVGQAQSSRIARITL